MKILNRKDFLAISKPVVFQKYSPMIIGELCIKEETLPSVNDFQYRSLVGCDIETERCQPNNSEELCDLWDSCMDGDIDFQRDYDVVQRDGLFESDDECWFVVYDEDDIRALINVLGETLQPRD